MITVPLFFLPSLYSLLPPRAFRGDEKSRSRDERRAQRFARAADVTAAWWAEGGVSGREGDVAVQGVGGSTDGMLRQRSSCRGGRIGRQFSAAGRRPLRDK